MSEKKQSKINHRCAVVKDINLALCHCCYTMLKKKICRQKENKNSIWPGKLPSALSFTIINSNNPTVKFWSYISMFKLSNLQKNKAFKRKLQEST